MKQNKIVEELGTFKWVFIHWDAFSIHWEDSKSCNWRLIGLIIRIFIVFLTKNLKVGNSRAGSVNLWQCYELGLFLFLFCTSTVCVTFRPLVCCLMILRWLRQLQHCIKKQGAEVEGLHLICIEKFLKKYPFVSHWPELDHMAMDCFQEGGKSKVFCL